MYRVDDFGATGDSVTDSTVAIQAAIDRCAEDGGGTVVLTRGTYVAGTVRIRSNVELRINEGTILKGSSDEASYPEIPYMFFDGSSKGERPERKGYALVYAFGATNVRISGGGIIDAGGERFQDKERRPFLMRLIESDHVTVENLTLRRSAAWSCHIQKCRSVTVRDVTIRTSGVRNGDGIDIDSSSNVMVAGCDVRTGDDAICLKTTSIDPCVDVEIRDCFLESDCSGVKIGTESVGDFRNVRVTDCTIANCGVVAVKITSVDGGSVESVRFENLRITDSTGPIFISNGHRKRRYLDSADLSRRSRIRNVVFAGVDITTKRYARTAGGVDVTDCGQGIVISGAPDARISNVRFTGVNVAFWGGVAEYDRDPETVPFIVDEYPECHQLGVLPSCGYFLQFTEGVEFEECTETLMNCDCRPLRWEREAYARA